MKEGGGYTEVSREDEKALVDFLAKQDAASIEASKQRGEKVVTHRVVGSYFSAENGVVYINPAHPDKTRATTPDVAKALIKAAPKLVQKLFLLWLFKHGERVTDAANIEWGRIDFEAKTYRHYERKNDKWRTAPIDDEVLDLLLLHKKASKDKKTKELPCHVFPWRSRHSVYNWLIPLRDGVGVTFTPHMARHTVGTMLNAQGASLRTIMERLGHTDVKSSLRYQAGDIEVVREAGKRLPRLG